MSFYCSTNTILNALNKPSEHVLMKLLFCNCVPILTSACEVKRHSGREMTNLDVALNEESFLAITVGRARVKFESRLGMTVSEIFAKRSEFFEWFESYWKFVFPSTHYHTIFTSGTDVISTVEPRHSTPTNKAPPLLKQNIISPI